MSEVWRTKQLEYTWTLTLAGHYADFWTLTERALDHALARFPSVDRGLRATLLDAYFKLDAFADARAALAALKRGGVRTAILSNGSPRMLEAAVASSGLGPRLQHLLSVDAVKTYKPTPSVYALGPRALGVPADALLFVSSNAWDVAGAKAFGYQVAWCNRNRAPAEELGVRADFEIGSLTELPA